MLRYVVIRLSAAAVTLVAVSILVFSILRLVPGDPVRLMFGLNAPPPSELELIRRELGLDRPLLAQYAAYMGRVLRGDLGRSYRTRQDVATMIAERFPRTVKLTLLGMLVAATLGIASGVVAGVRRGSWVDMAVMTGAVVGVSVPAFWFGMVLILIFSVQLRWFPVAGSTTWKHLVLPAATLGVTAAGVLARVTRAGMVEVLTHDYIRTARAKGLAERVVHYRHALKNVLIPVVSIMGLQVGYLLSGAVVVESVFGYAGMGQLAVYALNTRDYPVVQAVVLLATTCYVLVNLVVDIAYGFLDPRIRYA